MLSIVCGRKHRIYALVLLLLSDVLTVDRAVENIGFGWFQVKLSLFTGLVWVCDTFVFTINGSHE